MAEQRGPSVAQLRALAGRHGTPLLVLDCAEVGRCYRELQTALPGVELHYALKPLPHAAVVVELREQGASFDLASSGEVDLVKAQGIAAARCIHTHPVKRDADIRDALRFGVTTFVADNVDEIAKFVRYRRRVQLLLRVAFRSPSAVVDLSKKFGCEPDAVPVLLARAQELGVRVRGLSFHVGSQASDPAMYVQAIERCRELMAEAGAAGLPALEVLDIGGGFPVSYAGVALDIVQFCAPIRAALATLPPGLRVIAEPGRRLVASAGTSIATVLGRALRQGRWWYYLDDGAYGCFSGQVYDHAEYPLESLDGTGPARPSVLAGPTCDSIDVIREGIELPELAIGDRVAGRMMGAYTWATATDFNFMRRARVVAVNETASAPGVVTRLPRRRAV